jgi:hypothetical protein
VNVLVNVNVDVPDQGGTFARLMFWKSPYQSPPRYYPRSLPFILGYVYVHEHLHVWIYLILTN